MYYAYVISTVKDHLPGLVAEKVAQGWQPKGDPYLVEAQEEGKPDHRRLFFTQTLCREQLSAEDELAALSPPAAD